MMRMLKILVIVVLSSLACKGQIYIRSNNSYGVIVNRHRPDSTQLVPTFCGAPSGKASLHSVDQKMSALYYDSCGHNLYIYNPTDSSWSIAGGGADNSIATGSRTATGDYIQDWANHWFYLNNLKSLNFNSNRIDPNYPGNHKTFSFYSDSTASTYPLWLRWSLRNVANNQDSVGADLTFGTDYFQFSNYNSANYADLYASGNLYYPSIQMLVGDGAGNQSNINVGSTIVNIYAQDSVRMKLVPATTADSIVALRSLGFGLNTLVKIPASAIGGGGSATLSNQGSGFRLVKTSGGQIKTLFGGFGITPDSSTNTNAITFKADTSSTNHLVTHSALKDTAAAIRAAAGGGTPGGSTTQIQFNSSGAFAGDAGLTYDAAINKLSADSIDLIQSHQDSAFLQKLSPYPKPDTAYLIGDSHTVGQGATTTDSAYAYRESFSLDAVPVSVAVSGTGSVSIANRFLINKNPGNTTAAICMIGFNDPRRNGLPRKTLNKIINAHKAIFANQYLKSYVTAGGGGVTRTGSFTAPWDASAEGGKTTVGTYTNTTNDHIDYTFTDSTVIVGVMGGDGSSGSYIGTDIEVKIDGSIVATINTNNQTDGVADGSALDNHRCAMAFIFTGLTNASHTIRLTKLSTGGGGYMICDYFGHLVDKSQSQLMLWHHIPKMDATGYATSPANATNATTDTINVKMDSLKTTYPISAYPTYVVHTNDVFVVTTDNDPDHIHMNNSGHRKVADYAINTTLHSVIHSPSTTGALYYTNEFKGIIEGAERAFLMKEDGDMRYLRNQSYFTQSASYNISGSATADRFVTTGSIMTGNLTTADRQANGVAAGIAAGGPVISIRSNPGTLNAKTFDWFVGSNGIEYRVLSDNLGTAPFYLRTVTTSGPSIDTIQMPILDIIGKLKVYTHAIASNSDSALIWNRATNEYEVAKINGAGGSSMFLNKQYTTTQNSGTSQTDLYTYTIPANTLTTDGDVIDVESAGFYTDATATMDLQLMFNGSSLEGTTPLALTGTTHWSVKGRIIRTSSSTARSTVTFSIGDGTGQQYIGNASSTSLDFTSGIVLKITATAGGAGGSTGDILGHLWTIEFKR